ncbi:11169_t:CDS:2, partial [Cetraspora pellucida]
MTLSPAQRANFATISRLLSCVINEHLVKALYYQFQHDPSEFINSFAESSINHGVIFVLPEHDKFLSIDNKNIIIIPMLHDPILSKEQDNISTLAKVDSVDPWDMSASVYQVKYDPFQLVNLDNLKSLLARPMNEKEEISPSEFMSLLGIWMNLDEDLISLLCAELDSSVKYQVGNRTEFGEQGGLCSMMSKRRLRVSSQLPHKYALSRGTSTNLII